MTRAATGMTLAELAEVASTRTGLPNTTCMTLLQSGWTLSQRLNEPTVWIEPGYGHADVRA